MASDPQINDLWNASRSRSRGRAAQAGRFTWHYVQMLLAMGAGMALFHPLVRLVPPGSSYATALERGAPLHAVTMTIFMIVPMVAWMLARGHGTRHSAEMVVAMVVPMAFVGLLCQLGLTTYLPWLGSLSSPAMLLGMLAAMLYRRDHYTGRAMHVSHAAQPAGEHAGHVA